LRRYFRRNGYVRRQNPQRLAREGYMGYKQGDEVRLTAQNELELHRMRALLARAGFHPGRPFGKGRQNRLPIYGREAVLRFLRLIKSGGSADPRSSPQGRPRGPQARVAGWCVSAEAGKGFPVPGREHPASGKRAWGKEKPRRSQDVVG